MIQLEGISPEMIANNITPFYQTHPGEVIKDELEARNISQKELSTKMGMSYKALNDILNERRPITPETAILFEAALGISAKTLMGLQTDYNISKAKQDPTLADRLTSIRKMCASWML